MRGLQSCREKSWMALNRRHGHSGKAGNRAIHATMECMARALDLLAACEAFVAVADRESFTTGAQGADITQSVASRRIAALEAHLGGRLFERSSRRVALTAFGRAVLPGAIRLVVAAQEFADDADHAAALPVTLAVPRHVSPSAAARVCAAAADHALTVELLEGAPRERAEWLAVGRAELVLQHVEPDRAEWTTPLGVGFAGGSTSDEAPFFLAELRPRRGTPERRRLWLQPEDDVPSVRDRLEHVRNGAGLVAGHLRFATSLVTAIARAISDGDLVLCTRAEAQEAELAWHPLGDLHLVRGYALLHRDSELADRLRDASGELLAELVGTTRTGVSAPRSAPEHDAR